MRIYSLKLKVTRVGHGEIVILQNNAGHYKFIFLFNKHGMYINKT